MILEAVATNPCVGRRREEAEGCEKLERSAALSLRRRIGLALVIFAMQGSVIADSYWRGGTGDFNVPASWNPTGVPAGVNAINDSGSNNVVLIQAGDLTWSPWDIRAGDGGSSSGAYLQTGSTCVVNGWFRLGVNANATGYYTLSNGVVNVLLQAHIGEAGTGVLSIHGGTFNVGQNPLCVGDGDFGAGGSGLLSMTGGTLNTALGVDLWLGEGFNGGAGGTGKMILSGGRVNLGGWLAVGRFGGIGQLDLSGGSITMSPGNAGNITLATAPSTGVVNQNGGALTNTVSQTWIAESALGTWNLNGGTDVLGLVLLTRLSGATGTFNLNGGNLFARQIMDPGGNGAFNFNGGVLHARADTGDFLRANRGITVQSGGAIIHSEGHDLTINQALANGGGGLTKLGAGSLTLAGQLAYTGATLVSNGSLTISAPNTFASSGCVVSGGATFGVMLASANAQLSVPTLTFAAAGGGLRLDFAGTGGQSIAPLFANSLVMNGPVTVNIAGYNFSPGRFPLVQYGARTGNGNFTLGSLPTGMAAQLETNAANQTLDLVVTAAGPNEIPWQPKQAPLMTAWAQQVNPTNVLPEYPRPQMTRPDWLSLNGVWQFQPGATNDPVPVGQNLVGAILVPFPMESALSGVMQYHPFSWYRRQFTVPDAWAGQRILLHCDAINWRSQLYVNGQSVGVHTGGYDPFSYDITPYLSGGTNELLVRVYSPQDNGGQPRGKQTLYPAGIMFTTASGIWQSVWLEPVPATSISSLRLTPDVDNHRLLVNVNISGPTNGLQVRGVAFDGPNQVAATTVLPGNNLFLNIPTPKLWSPTNPFLYDLQISLLSNSVPVDAVASYFGLRKISLGADNGFTKMLLNNQFVFQFGPLDQGYWPDGVYTAPTDAALRSDLEMAKALGFNMVRKHIKVEPQRWYYWADKLGILVWQDMPSCNSYPTGPPPLPPVDALDYIGELTALVTNHWNSPAIISWVVFNEGQGQRGDATGAGQTNTAYLASLVKNLDPSRLVNEASGWIHTGAGDVLDAHNYPDPVCPVSASQAVVCGEFGGVWQAILNHTWSPGPGEVSPAQAANSVAAQFETLAGKLPDLIQNHGLSAAVYTEISDVEIELAGLVTFDRKILKPNPSRMQTAITAVTGGPFPINAPPVPAPVADLTITAGQMLQVTNTATDSDVPAQTLTWSLVAPPGATINAATGLLTWRPTISQSPSTNFFSVVVADNGTPSMSATQNFSVFVLRPAAPVISAPVFTSGRFQCLIDGIPGPDYSIYATTNLTSGWQLLELTNPAALPFQFTDPAAVDFPQRYYRVLLGP